MTTDPPAAEREHAPVPVPNVLDEALPPRPTDVRAWFDVAQWDMMSTAERSHLVYVASRTHQRALDRIHAQDAELVKLRAEVARLLELLARVQTAANKIDDMLIFRDFSGNDPIRVEAYGIVCAIGDGTRPADPPNTGTPGGDDGKA